MAEKGEDEKVTKSNNISTKRSSNLDYEAWYEQLSKEYPILDENKSFWVRRGNTQKYTCLLCNISVQVSPKMSVFKTAILAHVGGKYHKKRYDTHLLNTKHEERSVNIVKDKSSVVNTLERKVGLMSCKQESDEVLEEGKNCLVFLDSIYGSFEKSNPVVKGSKNFIVKSENGRDVYCNLCNVLIPNSLNATEFRYNLWVHINEDIHRERLPNFSQVKADFEKIMMDLSEALPDGYKDEVRFFEIGPVFRYVKCSACNVAVSVNLHRLENHIKSKEHVGKKGIVKKVKSLETEPSKGRIRYMLKELVAQLDDQFKKDVKYLKTGKILGYVVCSFCCYVVLPTKIYLEKHLESPVHKENKSTKFVSRK